MACSACHARDRAVPTAPVPAGPLTGLRPLPIPRAPRLTPAELAARDTAAHAIWAGWVSPDVYDVLRVAAHDSIEHVFQVTRELRGSLLQFGERYSGADRRVKVIAVVECEAKIRTRLGAKHINCPNPHAPTIHTHVQFEDGNTCSPSYPDYATQLLLQHEYDAVICGDARPTFYWFYRNPLLGRDGFPATLLPVTPDPASIIPVGE